MSLEDYIAERLGNIPHRPRGAQAIRSLSSDIPEVRELALATLAVENMGAQLGGPRIEDFELLPPGTVSDGDLKNLIIAYYLEQGWALNEQAEAFPSRSVRLIGDTGSGSCDLTVWFTNDSGAPVIPLASEAVNEANRMVIVTCEIKVTEACKAA